MDLAQFPPCPLLRSLADGTSTTPSRAKKIVATLDRFFTNFFGAVTLIIALAVISSIPLLNILSLGYLLQASANIARSGRLRDGWVGLALFSMLGKVFLGVWLWTLPLRLLHSYWHDSQLISPGNVRAAELQGAIVVVGILIGWHLVWAILRGGRLRNFIWPAPWRFLKWLGAEDPWRELREVWVPLLTFHRLPGLAYLGAGGFAGAALWLAIPVGILLLAASLPQVGLAVLLNLLGAALLGLVVLYLPFLQTRFALSRRFTDFFELRSVREHFRRAPVAFWFSLTVTLLFALPLYLLKIELTPQEVAWLPNLVFVFFILPARFLVGWAMARSEKSAVAKTRWIRWPAKLAMLPPVAVYVFIVWLTQYLSWHGTWGLLEQHAFLVPAPLLGL
jgi:hypothetical protein